MMGKCMKDLSSMSSCSDSEDEVVPTKQPTPTTTTTEQPIPTTTTVVDTPTTSSRTLPFQPQKRKYII